MQKRGLSPVIATVLLISIVLILAAIIFLWARGFLTERTEKFDEPVENSCEDIVFEAEAFVSNSEVALSVVNQGSVPLYGFEIREKTIGTIDAIAIVEGDLNMIKVGETNKIVLWNSDEDLGESQPLTVGEEIELLPIILGERRTEKTPYTCDINYGQTITVQAN